MTCTQKFLIVLLFALTCLIATGADQCTTKFPAAPFPRSSPRHRKPKQRRDVSVEQQQGAATYPAATPGKPPSGATGDQSAYRVTGDQSAHLVSNTDTTPEPPLLTEPSHQSRPLQQSTAQLVTHPVSRLNQEAFRHGLDQHDDQEFVDYILKACVDGVNIGYEGPRFYREYRNWPSANLYASHVQADIDKDVTAGIKIGPFTQQPFPSFVGNPMGCFIRKRSNKHRVIYDMSWPPGQSINDFIDKESFRIQYLSLDDVISSIKQLGPHTLLAKLDLQSAFHHIPVRPADFELLGSTFHRYNPLTNSYVKEYYYDTVLQFGARSSPKLFSDFATAAKIVMKRNGCTYAEHYLDDYVTIGAADTNECLDNLTIMKDTCHDLGFSLNPSKVTSPNTVMEYLGIVIDTDLMQARISSDRLNDVLSELETWKSRHTATKRQILSLIGKLTFVSRVVRPGRTFVRRMISLACQVPYLHHKVKLSIGFMKDVEWWLQYLPQWNGVSMFYDDIWHTSVDLHIYTDSSDIAAAGYVNGSWFVVPFLHEFSELKEQSINWRELFAVVVTAATFGTQWCGKKLLFHCDNTCIVNVVNSGSCKNELIMDLIRKLFYISAKNNFQISMCYVNTKANDIADALSRLQFNRFRSLAPHADLRMTMPALLNAAHASTVSPLPRTKMEVD